MSETDAQRIASLLEEIRDGQRVQLERCRRKRLRLQREQLRPLPVADLLQQRREPLRVGLAHQ